MSNRGGGVLPGTVNQTATQQSKAAVEEAQQENRPFSLVFDRKGWPHWIDADHDCQDTRAEILNATSQMPVRYRNEKQYSVVAGQWYDPYSGKTWMNASDLDMDHVYPYIGHTITVPRTGQKTRNEHLPTTHAT